MKKKIVARQDLPIVAIVVVLFASPFVGSWIMWGVVKDKLQTTIALNQ